MKKMIDLLLLLSLVATISGKHVPHIVLILADDLGWNDLGFHQNKVSSGNPDGMRTTDVEYDTPWLDKLAGEAVRLGNYYVQPLCSPTRGSLMSGMFPSSTGFGPDVHGGPHGPSAPYGFPGEFSFLPQALEALGYATHMIGKWHLGHCDVRFTPTGRGFQSWTGYLTGAEGYFAPSLVADQNETLKKEMIGLDMRSGPRQEDGQVPPPYDHPSHITKEDCYSPNSTACYSTLVFAEATTKVIRNHNREKPLFLYVAFQATHNPLTSPDLYRKRYDAVIQDWPRRLFAGMVTAMDEAIHNITLELERQNMWDDTLLVFSTDNGGEPSSIGRGNNYPLRGGKVTNWEGGVRGIGFIRGTNNRDIAPLPGNITRMNLMHVVDWYPTLVNLAKRGQEHMKTTSLLDVYRRTRVLATPRNMDGMDQWDAIQSALYESPRNHILHNVQPDDKVHPKLPWDAIRVGEWKLLMRTHAANGVVPMPGFEHGATSFPKPRPYNSSIFLFHIPSDPSETRNLAEANPEKLSEMLHFYWDEQKRAHPDLFLTYGWSDPAADPKLRYDKAWGPFNGTNSSCTYLF